MRFQLRLFSFLTASASAFVLNANQPPTLFQSTPEDSNEVEEPVTYSILSTEEPTSPINPTMAAPQPSLNGWTADPDLPCFGLPGALPPTGYFDPIGFARYGISLNEVKRYREAEVQHGRVSMVAIVGYYAGESLPSPFGITGPANDQLQQTPLPAFVLLTAAIAAAELQRARIGWLEPDFSQWSKTLFTLRDSYYPGDLGFDPLGFKPSDAKKFADMQTRELQNGRLAMIGIAGIISQELVNHKTILDTVDFYQKVYSGVNPYE